MLRRPVAHPTPDLASGIAEVVRAELAPVLTKLDRLETEIARLKTSGNGITGAVTRQQAGKLLQIGQTKLGGMIKSGELQTFGSGRACRITMASIQKLTGDRSIK